MNLEEHERALLARPRMDFTRAECFGFYGYGDGCSIAFTAPGSPVASGCHGCERVSECWTDLRERLVPELFPDLGPEILSWEERGEAWIRRWWDLAGEGVLDPYSALMVSHLQIGSIHESGATITLEELRASRHKRST